MNAILFQIKDFNTRTEIKVSDTIQYYYVNDSFFTILNHPVKRLLVKKVNGLVTEIAFRYEKNRINAPQFLKYSSNEKSNSNSGIPEGAIDASENSDDKNKVKALKVGDESSDDRVRLYKQEFYEFVEKNTPITQKIKIYLNDNYHFISSQPNCQFDCFDKWESDYSLILIEKKNYLDQDGDNTLVFIDQSLLITTKLSKQ